MKICTKCKTEKQLDKFHRQEGKRDGKRAWCIQCFSDYHVLKKYGISKEDYEILAKSQENKCFICFKLPIGKFRLSVDHCHLTGRIRKLLCINCNTILGLAGDDENILYKCINYLKDYK